MKFTFVKEVDSEVNIYDGKTAKTGDVVEYEGFFAEKASNNPDFELVKPGPKAKPKAEVNS